MNKEKETIEAEVVDETPKDKNEEKSGVIDVSSFHGSSNVRRMWKFWQGFIER